MSEDIPPQGARSLVADKKYIIAGIAEEGLEVVHYQAAGTHARTGQYHAGAPERAR